MVSKCANPECAVPFRYFHEGKLFRMDVGHASSGRSPDGQAEWSKPLRRLEFFWLCPDCAAKMMITASPSGGVLVRPRFESAVAA